MGARHSGGRLRRALDPGPDGVALPVPGVMSQTVSTLVLAPIFACGSRPLDQD